MSPSAIRKNICSSHSTSPRSDGLHDVCPCPCQAKDAGPPGLVAFSFQCHDKSSIQASPSHTRAGGTVKLWTSNTNFLMGLPFRPLQLTTQVTTDASPTGWGTHCGPHKIHASWSKRERLLHINHLEMWAVIKAFRAFHPLLVGRGAQVITNNTNVMFYISKHGAPTQCPFCT